MIESLDSVIFRGVYRTQSKNEDETLEHLKCLMAKICYLLPQKASSLMLISLPTCFWNVMGSKILTKILASIF